eukprot:TRINITY_DN22134_c0_g1_i1.p1 TRINITY_DN22134_c0_g1~~TRINITY_DN22134_c0_g1_i1.p1  ORF type:complete len:187 (-),score=7.88 TRINITY_DN22134_c0_g1_i1:121-681(-)
MTHLCPHPHPSLRPSSHCASASADTLRWSLGIAAWNAVGSSEVGGVSRAHAASSAPRQTSSCGLWGHAAAVTIWMGAFGVAVSAASYHGVVVSPLPRRSRAVRPSAASGTDTTFWSCHAGAALGDHRTTLPLAAMWLHTYTAQTIQACCPRVGRMAAGAASKRRTQNDRQRRYRRHRAFCNGQRWL